MKGAYVVEGHLVVLPRRIIADCPSEKDAQRVAAALNTSAEKDEEAVSADILHAAGLTAVTDQIWARVDRDITDIHLKARLEEVKNLILPHAVGDEEGLRQAYALIEKMEELL